MTTSGDPNLPDTPRQIKISINLVSAKYTLMFVSFAIVMAWIFT